MQIIYLIQGKMSEGDMKILKSGERFTRRQIRVHDGQGKCIGREVTCHGPCYEWARLPRKAGLQGLTPKQ